MTRAAKIAGTALLGLVLCAIGLFLLPRKTQTDNRPLPPIAHAPMASPVYDDFAGAAACASCHQEQYASWRRSTHGRAGGPPGPELLLRAFNGAAIQFRDAVVIPQRTANGYEFEVRFAGGERQALRVDAVVGGGHMWGGGTQGFFTRYPDGTLRLLPFEIMREDTAWFCNTATRAERGWVRISSDMALADCGDWPPVRVLGSVDRFANCQECHGSQVEVMRASERPLTTRYRELSINCESCHGPARAHAESGGTAPLPALDTLGKNASVRVCFRCHALKDAIAPGYLPGRGLEQHYSVKLPLAGDIDLHVDGRSRTFAYQQGHLYSECFLNGSMNCVDCHEPHAQGYRDANGRTLASRFDDGQCLACHPSKGVDLQAHTRHAPQSAGSRCVACHMPYLQQPAVGNAIRYARSDHSIPVVRPEWDARVYTANACQLCHRDMSADSLRRAVTEWYGELKPQRAAIVALQDARADNAGLADAIQLAHRDGSTMVLFNALASYLAAQQKPDGGSVERALLRTLRALARHEDLDVAAAALAVLHATLGRERPTREFLIERAGRLGADARAIRRRWSILLGHEGDRAVARADAATAIAWYQKALEAWPNDPRTLLSLGSAYAALGDYSSALSTYERGLSADSTDVLLHINRGIALAAAGDRSGAERAYLTAQRINPYEPLAAFNLANLLLRSNQAALAIRYYERALTLDPGIVPAHLNLASAYLLAGDRRAAVAALNRVLRYEPTNARAQELLEQLSAATGAKPE